MLFVPSSFRYLFVLEHKITINFFVLLLTFSKFHQICQKKIFYQNFHAFIFIKTSVCTDFSKYTHKGLNFLLSALTKEIYLFTERKLIRYYYFLNINIVYRNRAFILMNLISLVLVSANLFFLSIFINGFEFFIQLFQFLIFHFLFKLALLN